MSDSPATPKLRRRWKRWAAFAVVLVIGGGVWLASGESERIRLARNLQLGMSTDQVDAIMGEPGHKGLSGDGHESRFYYSPEALTLRAKAWIWLHSMGVNGGFLKKSYDVVIHFDMDGRVASICRGSEFVGK